MSQDSFLAPAKLTYPSPCCQTGEAPGVLYKAWEAFLWGMKDWQSVAVRECDPIGGQESL